MMLLKFILDKIVSFLDLILHHNTVQSGFLEKKMKLFCIQKWISSKNFQLNLSEEDSNQLFFLIVLFNFAKLLEC